MSFRPGSRLFANMRTMFRQPVMRRRWQSTANPAQQQSAASRFLNSETGPKTVHFWAPVMKWAIVLTGVADFARPAESLSLTQNFALMCTGAIWTRWCFIIRPRNLFLAAVNFFLFIVGATQVTRIMVYRRSLGAAGHEAKVEGQQLKNELEAVGKKAEAAVKK